MLRQALIIGSMLLVLGAITACAAEEEGGNNEGSEGSPAPTATQAKQQKQPKPGSKAAILDALEHAKSPTEFLAVASELKVKSVERLPNIVHVTLETPEGGFEGASVADLAGSAGSAFLAIHDAGWNKTATVTFTGGLVDTATGNELPDEETGIFRLEGREARAINWANAEQVNWKLYGIFLHPALKQ